jgi:hypothetical protein
VVSRFTIQTTFGQQATLIQYSIKIPGLQSVPGGRIPLPAANANWHVAAYSCNDQRQLPKACFCYCSGAKYLAPLTIAPANICVPNDAFACFIVPLIAVGHF